MAVAGDRANYGATDRPGLAELSSSGLVDYCTT